MPTKHSRSERLLTSENRFLFLCLSLKDVGGLELTTL